MGSRSRSSTRSRSISLWTIGEGHHATALLRVGGRCRLALGCSVRGCFLARCSREERGRRCRQEPRGDLEANREHGLAPIATGTARAGHVRLFLATRVGGRPGSRATSRRTGAESWFSPPGRVGASRAWRSFPSSPSGRRGSRTKMSQASACRLTGPISSRPSWRRGSSSRPAGSHGWALRSRSSCGRTGCRLPGSSLDRLRS